jgi:hypothetical protein
MRTLVGGWLGAVRRFWVVAFAAVVIALGALFIFVVPNHLVHADDVPEATQRARIRHDDRATLLQSLVGVLVLVGAGVGLRQLAITREGQITERFTRAVDQLGHDKPDVRVGGIYALERIAKDSPLDRQSICEILVAYVRANAPWPPAAEASVKPVVLQVRAPDIHAAIMVLTRRLACGYWPAPLLLYAVDLRNGTFASYHFKGVNLASSNLDWSNLNRACLDGAMLFQAKLKGCYLQAATLSGSDLRGAELEGAKLNGADLRRAKLQEARLHGADLSGADLGGAMLTHSRANTATRWPDRFRPEEAGVVIEA